MYSQFKAAYVETEKNKLQLERKLARHEMEAKEKQISRMVDSLRQQKEDAQRNYVHQIQLLEEKKLKMETNFQSTEAKLQSRMKNMEDELKAKSEEVVKLSAPTDALKLQLETAVQEKEALERDLNGRISVLEDCVEADVSFISNFHFHFLFTIIIK